MQDERGTKVVDGIKQRSGGGGKKRPSTMRQSSSEGAGRATKPPQSYPGGPPNAPTRNGVETKRRLSNAYGKARKGGSANIPSVLCEEFSAREKGEGEREGYIYSPPKEKRVAFCKKKGGILASLKKEREKKRKKPPLRPSGESEGRVSLWQTKGGRVIRHQEKKREAIKPEKREQRKCAVLRRKRVANAEGRKRKGALP